MCTYALVCWAAGESLQIEKVQIKGCIMLQECNSATVRNSGSVQVLVPASPHPPYSFLRAQFRHNPPHVAHVGKNQTNGA